MDGLGKTGLEDLSLQSSLEEVLDSKSKNVIELHSSLVKDSDSDQSSNESISLEQSLRIFVIQRQELSSSSTNFRESKQYPERSQICPVQLVI